MNLKVKTKDAAEGIISGLESRGTSYKLSFDGDNKELSIAYNEVEDELMERASEEVEAHYVREMQFLTNHLECRIRDLYEYISVLESKINSHINDGHLPKIQGAGRLAEALKALGMDKDYEIVKPPVYS